MFRTLLLFMTFQQQSHFTCERSSRFNFLYYQSVPGGILNMVFPSPLIHLSANSFPILEFHQICYLRPQTTGLPAISPREICVTSKMFPCVASYTQYLFSITYANYSSFPTLPRLVYDQKRMCIQKTKKRTT